MMNPITHLPFLSDLCSYQKRGCPTAHATIQPKLEQQKTSFQADRMSSIFVYQQQVPFPIVIQIEPPRNCRK